VNRRGARNHGSSCWIYWPAGKPRLAGTWAGCWRSTAIPSAAGSRSTQRAAWMPAGAVRATGHAPLTPAARAGRD
jgi:hypothetical protein